MSERHEEGPAVIQELGEFPGQTFQFWLGGLEVWEAGRESLRDSISTWDHRHSAHVQRFVALTLSKRHLHNHQPYI